MQITDKTGVLEDSTEHSPRVMGNRGWGPLGSLTLSKLDAFRRQYCQLELRVSDT